MTLFKLERLCDNPRFRGLAGGDAPSLLGFDSILDDLVPAYGHDEDLSDWSPPKLLSRWKPFRVSGTPGANDYPCLNLTKPVVSSRAVDALGSMLSRSVELLPLITGSGSTQKTGDYFALNVLAVTEAMDLPACELDPRGGIVRFAFDPNRITSDLFYPRYRPHELLIVTDRFVNRCLETTLKGFCFKRIWPVPAGVFWKDLSPIELDGGVTRELTAKHTLIVLLSLPGWRKPLSESKPVIAAENSLDRFLSGKKSSAGTLYGTDYHEESARLFVQCGDVDKLVETLRPWIAKLKWKGRVRGVKKYGTVFDENARFVEITF